MALQVARLAACAALLLAAVHVSASECSEAVVQQADRLAKQFAQNLPVLRKAPPSDERTKRILLTSAQADQAVRTLVASNLAKCFRENDPQLKALGRIMRAVNDAGADALTEILDKDGWPVLSRFGQDVDRAAFLIVQHRDHDVSFQVRVLERLTELVARRETQGESYALLFDRVATAQGRLQRYGSQGECRGDQFIVDRLEPGDVDARRQAVGLPPLETYRTLVASRLCGGR